MSVQTEETVASCDCGEVGGESRCSRYTSRTAAGGNARGKVISSIDVIGEVCDIVFVVVLGRCVVIGNSVSCLRQVDVTLKEIALDSSDASVVIYDCDVDTVVFTVSIGNIVGRNWSWSNGLPEKRGVGQSKCLLIIPVNCSCRCQSSRKSTSRVNTRVINDVQCSSSSECCEGSSLCIVDLGFSRTSADCFYARNNFYIKCTRVSRGVSRYTRDDSLQESSELRGGSRSRNYNSTQGSSNTKSDLCTNTTKRSGCDTNNLVCEIVDIADFQVVTPGSRVLSSISESIVAFLMVLLIVVVVIDFQRCC